MGQDSSMRPVTDSVAQNAGLVQALSEARTESGRSLLELVDASAVLLIFLRHFGCSYCRQAISDVAEIAPALATNQVRPVFVHLGTPERAKPYFDYYGLSDVERISDPDAVLYSNPAFALPRQHPLGHFLLPKVWKGWLAGGIRKYGVALPREDSYQMPGIFALRDRAIVNTFRYKTIADQPDYLALIS